MVTKALTTILTIVLGVGAALIVYWILNKIAEPPSKGEERVKPYLYIGPAFIAIVIYLVYPAVLTVVNSFGGPISKNWVGFDNFTNLFKSHDFQQTLINTVLWIIIVPAVTVVLGLLVATLTDRFKSRRARRSPRRSSSCRWPSA